jgi:hypothetical protein
MAAVLQVRFDDLAYWSSAVCFDYSIAQSRLSALGQDAPLAVSQETSRTGWVTAIVRFKILEGGTLRH